MTQRRVVSLVLALFLLLSGSVVAFNRVDFQRPGTARVKSASSLDGATIPFELVNRHMILKVKVNDSRPLSFVLDTGDQFAIIDLTLAKQLGLKLGASVRVGGAGAAIQTGAFVSNAVFTIPSLTGFSQPITMALPINTLASRLGQDFDGIIGSEFIQQFVLEIDYQKQVLVLHDKERFAYSGPGESIPIQLRHGHPLIEAEVNTFGDEVLKGRFVLDLGAGLALALYSPFVAKNNLIGPNLKTIKSLGGAGAGGETSGQVGRIKQIRIGTFKIDGPVTLLSQDKAGAFADPSLAGNIGARIANKFRLFLDYSHSRIIFEPNSTFSSPYDQAHSGLSLIAEGANYRTFRVRQLLDSSPASEAGLKRDDVILSVDGKDAGEFSLNQLNDLFELPKSYKLRVRRGTEVIETTLTPRRLI